DEAPSESPFSGTLMFQKLRIEHDQSPFQETLIGITFQETLIGPPTLVLCLPRPILGIGRSKLSKFFLKKRISLRNTPKYENLNEKGIFKLPLSIKKTPE